MKRLFACAAVAAVMMTATPSLAAKPVKGTDPVTITYSCSGGIFTWSWFYGLLSGGATSTANC